MQNNGCDVVIMDQHGRIQSELNPNSGLRLDAACEKITSSANVVKPPMIQSKNRPACSVMKNVTKSTTIDKSLNDRPQNHSPNPTTNNQVKVVMGNVLQLTPNGGQLITIDGKQFYRANGNLRPILPVPSGTRVLNVSIPSGQASSVASSAGFPPRVPPASMLIGRNVQKLKRRRMNSDSTDNSDSDEDEATLLKVRYLLLFRRGRL